MEQASADTVILSDLHLGSEASRAREALQLLQTISFKRLILLGDIFCDLNFGRLKKDHWKFLGYVRKLSNPKRRVEVVWVEGNHDMGLSQVMSHLVGVRVYQEYMWDFAGHRHLAVHGHQFDRFVINNALLSTIGQLILLQIQKLDFTQKRFSRFLDRLNTRWLRLTAKVAAGALAHAKFRGADRVFCGHTHEVLERKEDGIAYYNCGAWTNSQPTYITIREEGVQVQTLTTPVDDSCEGWQPESSLDDGFRREWENDFDSMYYDGAAR
jgi:UDP-2,3-diacylglucosamine pyrophosphatase LpxH